MNERKLRKLSQLAQGAALVGATAISGLACSGREYVNSTRPDTVDLASNDASTSSGTNGATSVQGDAGAALNPPVAPDATTPYPIHVNSPPTVAPVEVNGPPKTPPAASGSTKPIAPKPPIHVNSPPKVAPPVVRTNGPTPGRD